MRFYAANAAAHKDANTLVSTVLRCLYFFADTQKRQKGIPVRGKAGKANFEDEILTFIA